MLVLGFTMSVMKIWTNQTPWNLAVMGGKFHRDLSFCDRDFGTTMSSINPNPSGELQPMRTRRKCGHCGKEGHDKRTCETLEEERRRSNVNSDPPRKLEWALESDSFMCGKNRRDSFTGVGSTGFDPWASVIFSPKAQHWCPRLTKS